MRMCYLSISHTNVFSVTVPPGRLQEGSGALIKAAFAGQECGLLRLGVTEGLGVRSQSLYSHGQPAGDWAAGPWGLAAIRHLCPLSCLSSQTSGTTSSSPNTLTCSNTHTHIHTPLSLPFPIFGPLAADGPPGSPSLVSSAQRLKKSQCSHCPSLGQAPSSKVKSRIRAKREKLIRGLSKEGLGEGGGRVTTPVKKFSWCQI